MQHLYKVVWERIIVKVLDFQRKSVIRKLGTTALMFSTQNGERLLTWQCVGNRWLPNLLEFSLNFTTQLRHWYTWAEVSSYNIKENLWTQIPTFSSLAFIVDVMVVGLINWKEGAALFGYCAGNFTSILTRWLLQCTDTVQLLSAASICKGQIDNCVGDEPHRVSRWKGI